jgi:thiosulfate/3-mercaptopyruvate sulfurtransferase
MGHEDVVVLDGGLPAWEAEGRPLEEGPYAGRPERHFTARYRADLVRDLGEMRSAVETGSALILDARPPGRFAGRDPEPRAGLRSGHMPGAVNVPVSALVGADGRMRSRAELEQAFADLGAARKASIVCTCGSGVTAPIVALALARIGRWDSSVYDGSWAEWGALTDTAVVSEK